MTINMELGRKYNYDLRKRKLLKWSITKTASFNYDDLKDNDILQGDIYLA